MTCSIDAVQPGLSVTVGHLHDESLNRGAKSSEDRSVGWTRTVARSTAPRSDTMARNPVNWTFPETNR